MLEDMNSMVTVVYGHSSLGILLNKACEVSYPMFNSPQKNSLLLVERLAARYALILLLTEASG